MSRKSLILTASLIAAMLLTIGAVLLSFWDRDDEFTPTVWPDRPLASGTRPDRPLASGTRPDRPLASGTRPDRPLASGTRDSTGTPPPASPPKPSPGTSMPGNANRTVFLIVMENTNWAQIKGSNRAPYINNVLLPMASYAGQYYNPPHLHPSLPNYLWLEAGTNFGITNDRGPRVNHQSTTMHLVTLLDRAGISWKSYQEAISGTTCPLVSQGLYAPKHNPMVYFDDVTNTNDPNSTYCIQHVRPFSELATDLGNNTLARYNFITPDLCHDMHNKTGCASPYPIRNGDDWLAQVVPDILNSQAYADGGVLFITWDEGAGNSDGPIGMLVLSPNAKGGGYSNSTHYTHSSTLRTLQEIFGVTPLLGDAAQATDLSDLFTNFP